jgi:hypothetical protein
VRTGGSTCATFLVGFRRGSEITFTATGKVLGGLVAVVFRVLLLTGIFVDEVMGVLPLDAVVLDFAAAEDEAEGLLDAVGRVARVAVRGGMVWTL